MLDLIGCLKQRCAKIPYRPKCKYLTNHKNNSIQFSSRQEVFRLGADLTAQGPLVKPTQKMQMHHRKGKHTQKRNIKQTEQKYITTSGKCQFL
jgi:hypothetical protein